MKFETYPGTPILELQEKEIYEKHLEQMQEIAGFLYDDLTDANEPSIARQGRPKLLARKLVERNENSVENLAGLEGARNALYLFYEAINAQYYRDIFNQNPLHQNLSFDQLPRDQQNHLYKLVQWQQDYGDFFATYADFALDGRIHEQFNEVMEDLISDIQIQTDLFYGLSLSQEEIDNIVKPLLRGAGGAAAGVNVMRQITDGLEFKWGTGSDDLIHKMDVIAFDDESAIYAIQMKAQEKGTTKILHASDYQLIARKKKDKGEASALMRGARILSDRTIPIYLIVGYNENDVDLKTATIHNTRFTNIEGGLDSAVERHRRVDKTMNLY